MLICNVGKLIKDSPFKREYLCDYLGVSANTLTNWCQGKTYPPADKLFKLAYVLKVPVKEFYIYVEE